MKLNSFHAVGISVMPSIELLQKCWEIALSQGCFGGWERVCFPHFTCRGEICGTQNKNFRLFNINVACVSCSYSVFCLYVVSGEGKEEFSMLSVTQYLSGNKYRWLWSQLWLVFRLTSHAKCTFFLILPSQLLKYFVWNCLCMSFFWGAWPKHVFLDGYSCDVIGSFKKGLVGQKAFDTILDNPA